MDTTKLKVGDFCKHYCGTVSVVSEGEGEGFAIPVLNISKCCRLPFNLGVMQSNTYFSRPTKLETIEAKLRG